MKKLVSLIALVFSLFGASQAEAGIPVIDVANLAQSIQQVVSWGQQYTQMAQQYSQLVQQYNQAVTTYNSMNGVRGMASLVNNPTVRHYLPDQWGQAMNLANNPGGYTSLQSSMNSIRSASQLVGIGQTGLDPNSAAGRAFIGSQNQVALNRAMNEAAYQAGSDRIASIQILIDRVDGVPDAKDVQDLQARIQAEQVMVQNENAKLAALQHLQQAQRDLQAQQARELFMQSSRSPDGTPRF